MIDSITDSLLLVMGEDERIIALMKEVGLYEQMQLDVQVFYNRLISKIFKFLALKYKFV